ncbi:MAG: hypothetical protein FGM33_09995 [Candidatus Kapabacteria bacterium]|nr:hypothetical protein [Candidatus Kapabacteria bacterium]
MKTSTKVVWLGYASIVLAYVWGIGIVAAIMARRMASVALPAAQTPAELRDLRGGRLLATVGYWLNVLVLAVIAWSLISTWVL